MKYLITTCWLIILSSALSAQTETKRPSWSQGLPERQTTQQPGKPGFKPETTQPDIQPQAEINAERPAAPAMDFKLSTQPELNLNIQPESIQQPSTEIQRRTGHSRIQNRRTAETESNPLHKEYRWAVVKTAPIDIPARHATKDQLVVRIYINPDGEVIRVAAGAPDVPAQMLKQAQKSIQNWQFEPPKDIGISDNIAKTFTIEIKTG